MSSVRCAKRKLDLQTQIGSSPQFENLPDGCAQVMSLLEASPLIGIMSVDSVGTVAFIEHTAAEMLFRSEVADVVGQYLKECLPRVIAQAVMEPLPDDAMDISRVVLFGWQLIITRCSRGSAGGVMCSVQRQPGLVPTSYSGSTIKIIPVMGLGPLGVLTEREVEVTAWIGMGLSVRQISEQLCRSIKTIENHRIAIGRKLGVRDRMDIGLVAFHAGLRPEDSHLERVA